MDHQETMLTKKMFSNKSEMTEQLEVCDKMFPENFLTPNIIDVC